MTGADFEQAQKLNGFFHVNAAPSDHRAGKCYAMVRLVSSQAAGSPRTEVDARRALVVQCESVASYRRLADVPKDLIPRLIGRVTSPAELTELMVRRYGRLRGWTIGNAGDLPVVVSWMRNNHRLVSVVGPSAGTPIRSLPSFGGCLYEQAWDAASADAVS